MLAKSDFYCDEVVSGKTPIDKLYESDNVLAFYHTKPAYTTHIVITSKRHIQDLTSVIDADLNVLNEILKVARDLARDLNNENGIRLITNMGKFQDTPHIHFHLVAGDKIKQVQYEKRTLYI